MEIDLDLAVSKPYCLRSMCYPLSHHAMHLAPCPAIAKAEAARRCAIMMDSAPSFYRSDRDCLFDP